LGYVPPIDERLVVALDEKFKDQAPDLTCTEKEVWYRAGQVSVVRWLRSVHLEQQQLPFTEGLS